MDQPARIPEKNTRNNERCDRDGVRIVQLLADQNIGCRESFHRDWMRPMPPSASDRENARLPKIR